MAAILLDIGNTNLKIYRVEDHQIVKHRVIPWQRFDTSDFTEELANSYQAIITSVVPSKAEMIKKIVFNADIELYAVGKNLIPDLKLKIENPEVLGADRLLGAFEAYHRVRGAVIVIDLGTALTIDFVSVNKEFEGGIIAPGLYSCFSALEKNAPLLAGHPFTEKVKLPGKNTQQCIHAGLYYLLAGGIEKVVAEFKRLEPTALIIATGGDFEKIQDLLNFQVTFVPDLLAHGMLRLAKMNKLQLN